MIEINWTPGLSQCRVFGWACAACLVAFGAWIVSRQVVLGMTMTAMAHVLLPGAVWGLAAVVACMAVWRPEQLRWAYLTANLIALPIGWLTSQAALAVMFYLGITPVGFMLRTVRRDSLCRRFDPSPDSYWVVRPRVSQTGRYFRQS